MGENPKLKLQPLADVHFNPNIRAPESATDPAIQLHPVVHHNLGTICRMRELYDPRTGTVGFSGAGNRHPQSRWRTQTPGHRAISHRIRALKPHSICDRTRPIRTFNAIVQQPHGATAIHSCTPGWSGICFR